MQPSPFPGHGVPALVLHGCRLKGRKRLRTLQAGCLPQDWEHGPTVLRVLCTELAAIPIVVTGTARRDVAEGEESKSVGWETPSCNGEPSPLNDLTPIISRGNILIAPAVGNLVARLARLPKGPAERMIE